LAGKAVRTPLLHWDALNALTGGRIYVKAEVLQRTGSFKFRGAYNKLAQLDEPTLARGVVAFSSGNHAQGVAAAAQLLRAPATIVMPSDAPSIKIANTRGYGATVQLYDRQTEDREAVAARIVAEQGATLVRPYDDPDVIAGQGTVGLEVVEQMRTLGAIPDAMIAPASGGGLVAGCALALAAAYPDRRVYTAEPEGFDDHARSLRAHRRLDNDAGAATICDALMAKTPGRLTFAINDRLLAGGLVVSDAEAQEALAYAFRVLKLVVEPSGAVALAAVLTGKLACRDRTVVVVCSGGNVDPQTFCRALGAAPESPPDAQS
jgi:threonine dehydratase